MMTNIPFMPESASTVSNEVDAVYLLLVGVSAVLTLIVALAVLIFAFKYRRRPGNEIPVEYKAYPWLEDAFIGIMFLVFMGLFVAGAKLFFTVQRPPDDALNVYVTGRQWMWKFQHVGGQAEINELHVPKGRAVRLTMASEDVIHSVYVPAFRVKRDVLPSRYSEMWFQATKTGTFHLFCTEYCGTDHSKMIGSVHVMEPGAYQAWLEGKGIGPGSGTGMVAGASPAEAGKQLFTQLGCETCHKAASSGLGPSLVGVYGSPQPLEGGQTVVADDTYLRESILNPRAKLVEGYQPVMPVFQGQISEDNVIQLITYIRSLSPQAQAAAPRTAAAAPPAGNAAAPTTTNPETQATASSQP